MAETTPLRRWSRYVLAAGLEVALLLPTARATAGLAPIETLPGGPDARIENVQVSAGKAALELRGTVRLPAAPLLHSDVGVGRLVQEAVVQGRTIAHSEAVAYRVVTGNRRLRLFGFRGSLQKKHQRIHVCVYIV